MKANKNKETRIISFLSGLAKVIIIPCLTLQVALFAKCTSNERPLVVALMATTLILYAIFIEISARFDTKVKWVAMALMCMELKEEFILKNKSISDLNAKVLFARLLIVPVMGLYMVILNLTRNAYRSAIACSAILMIIYIYGTLNIFWSLLVVQHKVSVSMEENEIWKNGIKAMRKVK